jgi:hypothetical protein
VAIAVPKQLVLQFENFAKSKYSTLIIKKENIKGKDEKA